MDELPKTVSGKIRRAALRSREVERKGGLAGQKGIISFCHGCTRIISKAFIGHELTRMLAKDKPWQLRRSKTQGVSRNQK